MTAKDLIDQLKELPPDAGIAADIFGAEEVGEIVGVSPGDDRLYWLGIDYWDGISKMLQRYVLRRKDYKKQENDSED